MELDPRARSSDLRWWEANARRGRPTDRERQAPSARNGAARTVEQTRAGARRSEWTASSQPARARAASRGASHAHRSPEALDG